MEVVTAHRKNLFTPDDSIEITIAPNAGACFGVVRAIKLGLQAAKKGKKQSSKVFSFGALVHNPMTVEILKNQGVQTEEDSSKINDGIVILRSHGVKKEFEKEFKDKGMSIVDATCPLVKKPQRIASGFAEKGYFLVLVGDPNHPEVKGVLSYYGKDTFLVTYDQEDIAKIPSSVTKVGVLAQTTIEVSQLEKIVEACNRRFKEVVVQNTICDATSIRQSEIEILAQSADVMIVVGGKNSSNTKKLLKICQKYQTESYLIEEFSEINPSWFEGKRKIGISGGASTPQDYVDKVGDYVAELLKPEIL